MINQFPILGPVLAQALIFFLMAIWAVRARSGALAKGEAPLKDVILGQKAYPEAVQRVSNAFNNQFETPVYFFMAAVLSMLLPVQDAWIVIAGWVYVASRIAHIAVYVAINHLQTRFGMFFIGFTALGVMWARLAVEALTSLA